MDRNRLKVANRGLPNTKFILGDANKADIPKADAIVLVHLLHHLDSFGKQETLIKECRLKLRKNGKLKKSGRGLLESAPRKNPAS